MPVTAPDSVAITNLRHCARCGGDHPELTALPLTQPFAPPEAAGVSWSHWMPCPTNGQPILVRTDVELVAAERAALARYVYGGPDVHPNDVPLSPEELEAFSKFDEPGDAINEHDYAREQRLQAKAIRAVREIRLLRGVLLSKATLPHPYNLDAIVNGDRRMLIGMADADGRVTVTVTLDTLDGNLDAVIASANVPTETELSRTTWNLEALRDQQLTKELPRCACGEPKTMGHRCMLSDGGES